MIRFAHPWVLLGLLLPVFLLRMALRREKERLTLRFPGIETFQGRRITWRARLFRSLPYLRSLALALLVMALARPQYGFEQQRLSAEGRDIMLVLDASGSMRAEDFKPNRIAVAKRAAMEFLRGLQHDRVGLVVFAGRSFTQCPLTMDYNIVLQLLEEVDVGMVRIDGTAIGDALANALYKLELQSQEEKRRGKVVVLLTDGENNTGLVHPLTAAEMARQKGVKVHAIGLGTPQGAPVPYDTPWGRRYVRNPDGSLLITRLDEQTLRRIAQITGGRYFRATDEYALREIYRSIAQMEKSRITLERYRVYRERAAWFLLPALLLLLLEGGMRWFWLRPLL